MNCHIDPKDFHVSYIYKTICPCDDRIYCPQVGQVCYSCGLIWDSSLILYDDKQYIEEDETIICTLNIFCKNEYIINKCGEIYNEFQTKLKKYSLIEISISLLFNYDNDLVNIDLLKENQVITTEILDDICEIISSNTFISLVKQFSKKLNIRNVTINQSKMMFLEYQPISNKIKAILYLTNNYSDLTKYRKICGISYNRNHKEIMNKLHKM